MHPGNIEWLSELRKKYPENFINAKVLDIGSYDMNGSARQMFSECRQYVGVDVRPGPGVDVVATTGKTSFKPGEFDTIVYLSVFEHDPDWDKNFLHNLQWVKKGGLIITGWGAEGNVMHGPLPWALVPHKDFSKAAKEQKWPVEILDEFFEGDRYTKELGAYDALCRKL